MRMTTVFLHLGYSRADGLCPVCFLPSVMQISVKRLKSDGVDVSERLKCKTCGDVEEVV